MASTNFIFNRFLPKFKKEVRDDLVFALDIQELLDSHIGSISSPSRSYGSSYRSALSTSAMSAAYGIPSNQTWADLASNLNFGSYANTLVASDMPTMRHNPPTITYGATEGIHLRPNQRVIDDWMSDIHNSSYEELRRLIEDN